MKSRSTLQILHLEDSSLDAELVHAALQAEGFEFEIERADDRISFLKALEKRTYDLVLADHSLPSFDGVSGLKIVRERYPGIPFIFISGTIGEDLAIEFLKAGATDYVLKHRLGRLGPSIRRALIEAKERSEREAAESDVRQQAQLLDLARDCIVVRDLDDNVTYWNQGAQRLFGWDREDVIGRKIHQMLRTEFPRDREEIRDSLLRNAHWEGELVQKRRDGSSVTMESRWTLQRAPDGSPLAVLEISSDVTERRALEAQFLQAQKMESVGRLASGVAHDFNNLLTVIIGRSYLLLSRGDYDERTRKDLDLIQKTAERAAVLTRQLLAFSRRSPIAPRLLDLNQLIGNMDKMLRRLIGEDIDVFTRLSDNLGLVKADQGQIEQVIMNLVVNARDAMPNGGKLTIETSNVTLDQTYISRHSASNAGPHVMIAVSDTGVGMDEETRSRIFEPFFTTKETGTGLGLSTVYGIVKQSNANIWVYSERNLGSSFKIYFPRVTETNESTSAPADSQQIAGGSETILLVEDEQAVREIIRESLSAQGYRIIEARHGPDALLAAEKFRGRIHLLLTDVVMPAMSGPELAKALVKSHPEAKCLYMSGYTDSAIMRQGLLDDTRNFMQKPFTQVDLNRRVREALDS